MPFEIKTLKGLSKLIDLCKSKDVKAISIAGVTLHLDLYKNSEQPLEQINETKSAPILFSNTSYASDQDDPDLWPDGIVPTLDMGN